MIEIDERVAREQAYQVARGVRELAEVSTARGASEDDRLHALSVLAHLDPGPRAQPYALLLADGLLVCGYAAHAWAIDLYRWARSAMVPDVQRHRLLGLLYGYGGDAIRDFEERSGAWSATAPEPPSSRSGSI